MKKIFMIIIIGLILEFMGGCATVSIPDKGYKGAEKLEKPITTPVAGDGIFGKWIIDRFGLPAYEYTMDELSDPRAEWDPKLAPKTKLMWFPIGNQRIVATAFNHGFVQLFYYESDPRWINFFDPEGRNYTGGFGFIQEGQRFFPTLYLRRPKGAEYHRIYGMGYFEKIITHSNLRVDQVVYAPYARVKDLPVLISEVSLKNLSDKKRTLNYFEYWDVNIHDVSVFLRHPILGGIWKRSYRLTPRYFPKHQLLMAEGNKVWGEEGGFPKKPRNYDPEPPSVFLAALSGEVLGYEFDQNQIFSRETGWITGPETLEKVSQRPLNARLKNNENYCLMLRQEVTLEPGEEKRLHFVFGYAKAIKPKAIIDQIREPQSLLKRTMLAWKQELPLFQGPPKNYLSREVQWNYYCLNALSLIDGYYETPFVPQGGNYLYSWGSRGVIRDLSAYAQTFTYYNPDMAKNQLRLILRGQAPDGRFFYGMGGYGTKHELYYRPSDFDLWVMQAVTEYVFATRDFDFLDEEVFFYLKKTGGKATVYEHTRRAFDHFIHKVGTGKHGLIRLKLSDWNDEMTFLTARNKFFDTIFTIFRGESTLNTAMACFIFPQFADLAEEYGDYDTAELARAWTQELVPALQAQWRRSGWLNRAYSGRGIEYGDKEFFLEPQIWTLLSGNVLTPEQAKILIANMKKYLIEPSALGMMISASRKGSKTTRPGEQEEGGIWFAMNAPGIVAISMYDPDLAYKELLKNSLTWHADTYPELWYGIWSGPDSFNSVYSNRPGETWYQKTPIGGIGPQEYPVMNAHSHAQILYALAQLAGLKGTVEGYLIDPKIPSISFSFQTQTASVKRTKNCLQGSFVFQADGEISVKVKIPSDWGDNVLEVRVNGEKVKTDFQEGLVRFKLSFQKQLPATWKISSIHE